MRMVSHLRPVTDADRPAVTPTMLVDPPPFGSPMDLAETLCRQADDLAAVVEHCRTIEPLTRRIVLNQLGEMRVMLDELASQLADLVADVAGGGDR